VQLPIRILFVCSRNRRRSPTAEVVFAAYAGVEALSAGTSPDAETPLSVDLIEWADLVLAMESVHRRRIQTRFGSLLKARKIAVLGVPDEYEFMDPELVRILKLRVERYVRDTGTTPAG
jgi:predicted protein tyrosine phosphatase